MKKIVLLLTAVIFSNITAFADDTTTPTDQLNAPFGWTNCKSLTTGDDYTTTGGNNGTRTITLKSTGSDQKAAIQNAIKQRWLFQSNSGWYQRSPPLHPVLSNRRNEGRTR